MISIDDFKLCHWEMYYNASINETVLTGLFQDVIAAQERTITDLLKAVREQHDQLNHQKTKIRTLEEKVHISVALKR
jgi:hypothetical protein